MRELCFCVALASFASQRLLLPLLAVLAGVKSVSRSPSAPMPCCVRADSNSGACKINAPSALSHGRTLADCGPKFAFVAEAPGRPPHPPRHNVEGDRVDWVLQNKRSYLLRPPRTPLLNFVQRGVGGGARCFDRKRQNVVAGPGVGAASRQDERLFCKHR